MTDEITAPTLTVVICGDAAAALSGVFPGPEFESDATVIVADPSGTLAVSVNAALEGISSDYVAIISQAGELKAEAVSLVRAYLDANGDVDVLYGDETQVEESGTVTVIAKPDYSPERLRCQFYLGAPVFYRRSLVAAVGGLDPSFEGAELYDLALRATRAADSVVHLDTIMFANSGQALRGPSTSSAQDSTMRVLQAHLDATGGGEVRAVSESGIHDTRRLVKGNPLVSIVIPTRGLYQTIDERRRCYVVDAVRSIIAKSTYTEFEIVLVIDAVADPGAVTELREIAEERLRFVEWDRPFNFSDKVNLGVLNSHGEFVLILNDDVDVITPDWIEALLALAQLPGAGMSGGMLYYEDDTIQHAGHAYWEGDATHIGLDTPRGDAGPLGGYLVEREVVGVTAACAMMPRDVYFEVGGLSSLLPGNFNDVDLCMKTTWRGHQIYWTPHAELYHFESKTRDATVRGIEIDVAWGRWSFRMHDPRYWPYPPSRSAR